ncbi:MAG: hypothetical protein VX344_05510 [Bacteroidota bacterium]|nr:hypothetical protein [Bacteroidota bacterium]
MLQFCKTILKNVSFDKQLFKKELYKSLGFLEKSEQMVLKVWCLSSFAAYKDVIVDVFERNAI